MKKLMFLFAATLLVLSASSAFASMGSLGAIDSHGVAVVSIHHPASGVETVASTDKVYLDSNHIWAANDLKGSQFYASTKVEKANIICLDSISRFCVRSY